MRRVRGRVRPQGSRVYCTQPYGAFLQKVVSTVRSMTFKSHGNNFTSYTKSPLPMINHLNYTEDS
uniref:Putative ovule protein n=1 Tax=Solanum chacoense TaxID=4108 RepID=A0A0V0GJQ8_SOLCH